MANLFEGLPHMIGAISNLSGNEIHRAMVSIKSENRRRQTVFNLAGVNNINSYTKLVRSGEAELPVPHLFIVVDEFAELKREQPEFMKEPYSVHGSETEVWKRCLLSYRISRSALYITQLDAEIRVIFRSE